MHKNGFTLLELMIAIAMGMLVIYITMQSVRVAANTVTKSNRIAVENELLRVGFIEALDEVDLWSRSDNPDALFQNRDAEQALRKDHAANGGMSFTPLPSADMNLKFDESFGHGAWNQHPSARAAANPRTWTRVNYFEENNQKHLWGTSFYYSNMDSAKAPWTWQSTQIKLVLDTMGFWGAMEYQPANAFFGYYGSAMEDKPKGSPGGIAWTQVAEAFTKTNLWIRAADGNDSTVKGRARSSNGSRYALPGPGPYTRSLPGPTAEQHRAVYKVGYELRNSPNKEKELEDFLDWTRVEPADAGARLWPTVWPQVYSTVRRIIIRGQMTNSVVISCVDPLTGNAMVIPFSCTGTTLRGARQQRGPVSGWANDEYNGPSMDYPTKLNYDQLVYIKP